MGKRLKITYLFLSCEIFGLSGSCLLGSMNDLTCTQESVNELKAFFMKNTDKSIDKWLHYFEIYDKNFKKYKDRAVNVLEIGVGKGGSSKMWRSYFGEKANIYAIEINPDAKAYEAERIKIFIGDQADRQFIREVLSKIPQIDIVIDDGGHTTNQQITSFEEIYPTMSVDGMYLVEDTHTNYWPNFIDTENKETFIEYSKKLVDLLHEWWWYDARNFERFCQPHEQRIGKALGNDFAKSTLSINFYDSVIVFERGRKEEPYREVR